MRELANELATGNNEVYVITQRYRGSLHCEKIDNISIERFNWLFPKDFKRIADFQKIPYLRMVSYLLSGIFRTIRTIVREKPDIIYAHWAVPSGLIAMIAKLITNRPLIIQVHGSDVRGIPGSWAEHPLLQTLIKMVLSHADGLVTVSNDLMTRVKWMGIKVQQKRVIPLGIDLKTLEETIMSIETKDNIPTILFVGALREVKGLNYLLDAVPLIKKEIPDFKIILAGDGPQRDILKKKANSQNISNIIDFCGQVPHTQVLNLMKSSDIVILPSLSEGTPTVMFEALACKTPFIATRVGGIPDVITHNLTGILIEPNNTQAIANAIINLLKDYNTQKKLAENGYNLIKNQYTMDITALNLLKLFKTVLR